MPPLICDILPTSRVNTRTLAKYYPKQRLPPPKTSIANSEDSFIHVESQPDMEHRFENSVGGDELRQIRRRQEEREAESDLFSSALSAAALASAGVTVLFRFASRSSARRSFVGQRSTVYSRTSSTSSPKSAAPVSSSSALLIHLRRRYLV